MWAYRPIKTIRTDTTLDLSQKAEKSDIFKGHTVTHLFTSSKNTNHNLNFVYQLGFDTTTYDVGQSNMQGKRRTK
jgi:phosphosulfolactate synthase (CoM biosynthesis protein A)